MNIHGLKLKLREKQEYLKRLHAELDKENLRKKKRITLIYSLARRIKNNEAKKRKIREKIKDLREIKKFKKKK